MLDLPDLRRRILANEPVSISDLQQAISQLRANRLAPVKPERKSPGGGGKANRINVSLDDALG